MKDFSLDKENAKTFILNYKIKEGKIIINFASKKKYTIPYTKQNEEQLINKMQEQVTNEKYATKYQTKYKSIKFYLALAMIITGCVFASKLVFTSKILTIILGALCAVDMALIASLTNCHELLKDIKKNKLFLENQQNINNSINEYTNILKNTDEYVKKVSTTQPDDNKIYLDANSIDKLSLKQLKELLDTISCEKAFTFEQFSNKNSKNGKAKVRTKKPEK